MELPEVLEELRLNRGYFPREAIEEAVRRREEITPILLDILENAARDMEHIVSDECYMAHIYAMFLLAQFRERRAYPLIVRYFSTPGEISLDSTGDVGTASLSQLLASVAGDDDTLIKALVENEEANPFARSSALSALTVMVACGVKDRGHVVEYVATLMRGKLPRHEDNYIWTAIIFTCRELAARELREDVTRAFKDNLIEPYSISFEAAVDSFDRDPTEAVAALSRVPRYQMITDTVAELSHWACFREDTFAYREDTARTDTEHDDLSDPGPFDIPDPIEPLRPFTRELPKVGRNDPCPCGSGKKAKKCCRRG